MAWFNNVDAVSGNGNVDPFGSFQSHAANDAAFAPMQPIASAYDASRANSEALFSNHVANSSEAALGAVTAKDYNAPGTSGDGSPTTNPNPYYDPWETWGIGGPTANSASSTPPETPQPYDFMDTSLASMFGMDAATHYQEALANTAHQRQIRDLKAAGLNPVLGISGNGAAVFPGREGSSASSGSGSSGGGSYGSAGSGKDTSKLAGIAKTLSYSAPYLVGGVIGLATKNPYAASLGQSATQALINIGRYN